MASVDFGCQMSLPYEKTYRKPASFTARMAGDDWGRFRSMASTGMAFVADRIAFGARDSQSSFPADATPVSVSVFVSSKFGVWRAEDPGLAASGRRGAIIRPAGRSPPPPATRENRPASSRTKRTVSMTTRRCGGGGDAADQDVCAAGRRTSECVRGGTPHLRKGA